MREYGSDQSRSAKIFFDSRTPRRTCAPSGSSLLLLLTAAASAAEMRTLRPSGRTTFRSARPLHSGADDGKVKPIDRADIAVKRLAEMESKIHCGRRFAWPNTICFESLEAMHYSGGGANGHQFQRALRQ
jgi:hypothetical protein